ncbi:MAG TPA: hypothetical protein VJM33_09540 [Microthrixaceae bacterium]|nr:hypothetical protein [Microthrixaceae bacterium]
MQVLIVSPHFDDAPLSLGQSMLDGGLAAHRVTVGVVFGRTNWVRWWHPTRRRAPLVGAIRRFEEAHAAVRFGYRVRVARFEEAIMRLGSSDTNVYLDPGFEPYEDPQFEPVIEALRRWALDADLVLAPLGIGDHVDHRLAAGAGRVLAAEGVRVAHYEDRPYASFCTDDEVAARARALDAALESRPASGPINDAKRRRIIYPSQMDDFFHEALAVDLDDHRPERVWVMPHDPWPARTGTGDPSVADTDRHPRP